MVRKLPVLLLIAAVVVSCSGQWMRDPKDPFNLLKKNDCPPVGPCFPILRRSPLLPPRLRWKRSTTDDKTISDETTIINSELPTDRILQEVQGRYIGPDEVAEILKDNNQTGRHRRAVRAVVIRVCHRRTGRCRFIIIYRK